MVLGNAEESTGTRAMQAAETRLPELHLCVSEVKSEVLLSQQRPELVLESRAYRQGCEGFGEYERLVGFMDYSYEF